MTVGESESEVTWYPRNLAVGEKGTPKIYQFLSEAFSETQNFRYAEFGFYRAATALTVAKRFPKAELHLFDYSQAVEAARLKFAELPNRVFFYSSTERYLDSYNWPLVQLLSQQAGAPLFDYCFLDGAHTFAVDALTFFLADRLLNVGGYLDFDDYRWRLRGSSLDPERVPQTSLMYTEEQIDTYQVALIVEELVRRDPRYVEVMPNKVFRKVSN